MKQRRKFAKPYQGQSETCRLHQMEGVSRREDVEFYITLATLTKKKTPGKTAKEVVFGAYPPNHQLCVVQCLKHYAQGTKAFRGSGEQQLTKLF